MKAESFSALDRLQASPPGGDTRPWVWLDAHKEDVVTVIQEKGYRLTSELLGLGPQTVYSWAHMRGLKGQGPNISKSPEYRRTKAKIGVALAIPAAITQLSPIPPLLVLEMLDLAARGNLALAYRRLLEHLLGAEGGEKGG